MRRQRRLGPHNAAFAFEAFEERGLLAADISAGADAQLDVEAMAGAEDVGAKVSRGARDFERLLEGSRRVRILRTQIDIALVGADGDRGDGHAFDQGERIAFHDHTVGESAAIALVRVADDVAAVGRRVGDGLPFDAGRKARAAAPAQARLRHLGDGRRGPDLDGALQAAPAAERGVIVERDRIDDAAAGEGQAVLPREEGMLLGLADAEGMRAAGKKTGVEQ